MTTITTNTVKTRLDNSKRRFNTTAFSDNTSGLASDSLINVDITKNNIVVTSATTRIGQETVKRKQIEVKTIVEDESVGVKRIGRVTILGDATSMHSLSDFKQGHNVKIMNETVCSMLPHITINSPEVADEFGNIVNLYEETTFGQLYSYNFNVISDGINKKFNSFFDYPGRLDPVEYVKRGKYYRAYMIINNNIEDYLHYTEPEAAIYDGAIDILETRSKKANLSAADIQVRGIRGSFCSGPWDLPAGSTTELRKGTSQIQDKTDFEDYEYDFFEDCQDLVFSDSKFTHSKSGETIVSGYQYSLDGYISTGKYMSPPFIDKIAKDRAYETRYTSTKNEKLQNAILSSESTRDISDIGTRFKSSGNGCILRPKYENVIQTILGTDSIAFAGLLRE